MTDEEIRAEMRAYVSENPLDWPALSPTRRLRLAALLRPDMPAGIRQEAPAGKSGPPAQGAA